MKTDEKYEGWANRETWLVNLWLTNDEPLYRYWTQRARDAVSGPNLRASRGLLAEAMQAELVDLSRTAFAPGAGNLMVDLLQSALTRVEWLEVASSFIQALELSNAYRDLAEGLSRP